MFVAEEAVATTTEELTGWDQFTHAFQWWDVFMFAFTILIAIGFLRILKKDRTNKVGLGFSTVALLVFLFLDVMIIANWLGYLDEIQDALSFLRSW